MNREDLRKIVDFDIETALRNFKWVYPEFKPSVIDVTLDKSKIVISVGDGYHAIDETNISQFFDDFDSARRA